MSTILPVASTTATLTPVRKPGSSPIVARPPAGAASRRSRRLAANTFTASSSAWVQMRRRRSTASCVSILVRHAQRAASRSQRSPGRPRSAMAKRWAIASSKGPSARLAGSASGVGNELEIENLLPLAAHQRERPVRRDFHQRLEEVEIVGELRPRRLLALAHFRDDPAASPEILAQPADELGVLGEALDEDRPRAVERVLRRLDRVGLHVGFALRQRLALGMGEKRLGERLEAVLARDLRLGAALRLERQIDVLEPRLRLGLVDLGLERGVELALLADRIRGSFCAGLRARAGRRGGPRASCSCVSSSAPVASLR